MDYGVVKSQLRVEKTEDLPDPPPEGAEWAYVTSRKELWSVSDGRWKFVENIALSNFKQDLFKAFLVYRPVDCLEELEELVRRDGGLLRFEAISNALKHGGETREVLGVEVMQDVFREVIVRYVMES
jgi:hypothetical protein